ncbi:MAG: hypothetical protein ISR77_37185 [Pirellulaceae bacterium]|nr:hypothetical protein [Pirellulaceae bacterium]
MMTLNRYSFPAKIAFVVLLFAGCDDADQGASQPAQPPINVDANANLYREYAGPFGAGASQGKCGVQVFLLDEQYWLVSYPNGLPGAGWSQGKLTLANSKPAKNGILEFTDGEMFYAVDLNKDTVSARGGDWATMLVRVIRVDPVIPGREKGVEAQ